MTQLPLCRTCGQRDCPCPIEDQRHEDNVETIIEAMLSECVCCRGCQDVPCLGVLMGGVCYDGCSGCGYIHDDMFGEYDE